VTVRTRVRQFILDNFYVNDPDSLSDETSLIDSGIVDSTGMMDIILFLETECGIRVEDDETIPENLESIDQIVAFVGRKLNSSAADTA
jgi:acyl carrier protein